MERFHRKKRRVLRPLGRIASRTAHPESGSRLLGCRGGWALDGDGFVYLRACAGFGNARCAACFGYCPHDGEPIVAFFAVFLIGWGCAFLWGPVADRFGRVRTLALTILCYSLFTFLGCIAGSVWQLGLFRFLAGIGIGGEWTLGGIVVAEEWPERRRAQGAAWMHTGHYFGIFLAAVINYLGGRALRLARDVRHRWNAGAAGAFIRFGVREPEREKPRQVDRAARFLHLVRKRISTSDAAQRFVPADRDDRPLGRIGLCARGRDTDCRARRIYGRRAALGFFFAVMAAPVFDRVRLSVLPCARCAHGLHRQFVFRRNRRRQLLRFHIVAPGTIPHRMPGQRVRFQGDLLPLA